MIRRNILILHFIYNLFSIQEKKYHKYFGSSRPAWLDAYEKNILQNGEQLQKKVNKGEKNRTYASKQLYGRTKDENNSFME